MSNPPVSILLPTVEWTDACGEVAEQLSGEDELLVICDAETDPVARHESVPPGVEIVVAGDPEGCSGKANAIDAGIEAACHDRLVWTDDDFHHPPDWLDQLAADYEKHGPVSETPVFEGRDPLAVFLESSYLLGGSLGTYAENKTWGGAVIFERDDLDLARFRSELCRTVSDDGLLSEYLNATTLRRTRTVPIGGSIRTTLERHVRFMKIVRFHAPGQAAVNAGLSLTFAAGCLLFPLYGFALVTLMGAANYAFFGVRRWTFLLAYPSTIAAPLLLAYALARRTFVWGGRRYRWRSKFDVVTIPD